MKSKNMNIDKEEIISESKKNVMVFNNIINTVKSIKADVIDISIDNTQKYLKERIADIAKDFNNNIGKRKKKVEKTMKAEK